MDEIVEDGIKTELYIDVYYGKKLTVTLTKEIEVRVTNPTGQPDINKFYSKI